MKKSTGSALIDYIIPTAIIGLVFGMGLYLATGNNLLVNFLGASANMKINLPENYAVVGNESTATSDATNDLTQGNLKIDCSDTDCTIKAGDLIIKGIPTDFSEIVNTSGASGGTQTLAAILDQVAEVMEAKGYTNESNNIKSLAKLGHQIAQAESDLANYDCQGTPKHCSVSNNQDLVAIETNFSTSVAAFNDALVSTLAGISTNKELSAIIEQPSNEIISLADSVSSAISAYKYDNYYDYTSLATDYSNISTSTHIHSAIICASGHGSDNGYNCN